MVELKACKVHCPHCLRAIDDSGFTFAGVHAIDSVGRHALRHANELMRARTYMNLEVELVLLTKERNTSLIVDAVEYTGYRWLQLHSPWPPEEMEKLRRALPPDVQIICLMDPNVMDPATGDQLLNYADFLLLDHHEGGTGKPIEQSVLAPAVEVLPMDRVFLSGGLTSTNVGQLISEAAPYGVDVQTDLLSRTGEQDSRRMANFVAAARGGTRQRPASKPLPLEMYSSPLWRSIDPELATREDLVAKFNLIETLETRSRYKVSHSPYWTRVQNSLAQLASLSADVKDEWLQAALVLFANVTYLPEEMLLQAWRSLYLGLDRQGSGDGQGIPLSEMHLLENDPSGMTGLFCHMNQLHGRLDTQTMARIEGVDKIADLLLGLANAISATDSMRQLDNLFRKAHWVLLVDKTLSGHSLRGDLERLLTIAEMGMEIGYNRPRISILAQVATDQAFSAVGDLADRYEGGMQLQSAIRFDARDTLNSAKSSLIATPHLRDAARDLCEWFGANVVARDHALDRMRMRSDDNLEFGYRGCGLIMADHDNCPTDSLPLLWYEGAAASYRGPYPRVHSRIGGQVVEQSQDKWAHLTSDEFRPYLADMGRRQRNATT